MTYIPSEKRNVAVHTLGSRNNLYKCLQVFFVVTADIFLLAVTEIC